MIQLRSERRVVSPRTPTLAGVRGAPPEEHCVAGMVKNNLLPRGAKWNFSPGQPIDVMPRPWVPSPERVVKLTYAIRKQALLSRQSPSLVRSIVALNYPMMKQAVPQLGSPVAWLDLVVCRQYPGDEVMMHIGLIAPESNLS